MLTFKKLMLFVLVMLILFSIIKDLKDGSPIHNNTRNSDLTIETTDITKNSKKHVTFQVVSYKVDANETFITIIDQLNHTQHSLDINQSIADFTALNPKADVHDLQPDTTYLFPLYSD